MSTDKGSFGRTGSANFRLAPSRADFTRGWLTGHDTSPAIEWAHLMPYTTASTEDTPILLARQLLVSSVIKNMQRFRRNNRDAKDVHARHLNQPDLYLVTVDEARDPICKSRRSGTKLRSDGSSKTATSFQMPDIRTSEKTNHKVNEKKTGKRKARTSSHRRSPEIGNTKRS